MTQGRAPPPERCLKPYRSRIANSEQVRGVQTETDAGLTAQVLYLEDGLCAVSRDFSGALSGSYPPGCCFGG